jgi:hypothetical protein
MYPVRKLSIFFPRVRNFKTNWNREISKTRSNAELKALDTRSWRYNAVLVLVKWNSHMELAKELPNEELDYFRSKKKVA